MNLCGGEEMLVANSLVMSLIVYGVLGAAVVGVLVVLYLSNRNSKKAASMLEELVLDERQQNRDGYTSVIDKSKFLGKIGVCLTDLRPAGTIIIDNEPIDVVTEGNFVKQGSEVKVVNVDGSRVLVRQI